MKLYDKLGVITGKEDIMVKKINEAEFAEVSKSKYAVVDFNATW